MSSLTLLCASTILDAVDGRQIDAEDLTEGRALFVHMLDTPHPVSTACGSAAVHKMLAAGAIPLQSCQEQLLQTIQQATSSLSSTNSSSLIRQSEQYVLVTLQHAVAALASYILRDHLTTAAMPVLLNLLQLQAPRFGYLPQASRDIRVQLDSKARVLSSVQNMVLSILQRFCHGTTGRQAIAAAGGIQVLLAGAEGTDWYTDKWSDCTAGGFCLLCGLTQDPAVIEEVVQAGAVDVLLHKMHPTA